jgi:hypothetical protein
VAAPGGSRRPRSDGRRRDVPCSVPAMGPRPGSSRRWRGRKPQ